MGAETKVTPRHKPGLGQPLEPDPAVRPMQVKQVELRKVQWPIRTMEPGRPVQRNTRKDGFAHGAREPNPATLGADGSSRVKCRFQSGHVLHVQPDRRHRRKSRCGAKRREVGVTGRVSQNQLVDIAVDDPVVIGEETACQLGNEPGAALVVVGGPGQAEHVHAGREFNRVGRPVVDHVSVVGADLAGVVPSPHREESGLVVGHGDGGDTG